jgi:peroxiredoxin
MQQIVDLQQSPAFNALDIELVNVAVDSMPVSQAAAQEYGVTTPFLVDDDKSMSEAYGVMRWATPGGEPSHTFVLVGSDGMVRWIQDYGAPENGGRMYVPPDELVGEITSALQ